MNGPSSSRRGSALLVVLGMLSFMVISGIAFSVFMRSTRMSSSFTRRTVATRQLAKAALAEAIDQIDRAVANDPHPGVRNPYRTYLASTRNGRTTTSEDDTTFDPKKIDNFWCGRILVGQGGSTDALNTESGVPVNGETYYPKFVDSGDTVPVLTLEALAYLPPSLVNEARFYGQRTPTAAWQTFSFDAGRFAYIAVDVSDYFDVNRILAGEARSSDPAHRVTLGHLFESPAHASAAQGSGTWTTFMNPFGSGSTPPLVSLADFNLALGQQSIGGLKSPFVQYVENGGNTFYGSAPGSDDFAKYGEMAFVTDSLEAVLPTCESKTSEGKEVSDLDADNGQIFTEAFLDARQEDRPLIGVSQLRTEPFSRLIQRRVPVVTMFNLSDYLDCDRIPISLGIPSVERVPMICGIKPAIGDAKVKVSFLKNPDNGGTDQEISGSMANKDSVVKVRRNVRWRLDATSLAAGFMGGMVQTLVVYPFRNHERTGEGGFFKLDGKVQLFLSSETMRLRTGNADDLLHWAASGDANSGGSAGLRNRAVLNLPISPEAIPLSTEVADPSKCVQSVNLTLADSAPRIADELAGDKGDLLNVTYEWERHLIDEKTGEYDNGYETELPPAGGITLASSALRPLKRDGTLDGDFSDDMKGLVAKLNKTLEFNMVVTLRVISSSGEVLGEGSSGTKTVDMVPATLYDDKPLNNVDNSMGLSAGVFTQLTGEPTPLMKFATGVSFPVKLDAGATCDAKVEVSPKAVMVDDPRYNHAPENWRALDTFSESGWLAATTAAARDGDIYMATSDQDYMQSVYEFGFLPRLSNLENYGDAIRGDLPGYPSGNASWTALCAGTPVDANFMWKTYDVFGRYSADGDDFEGLGLQNLGRGLKVNPYSDSASVIMGAFANTPHDWRAASDNEDENKGAGLSDSAFNAKYAWNEYSSGETLSWAKLEAIADEFSYRVQRGFQKEDEDNRDYRLQDANDNYTDVLDGAFRRFFGTAGGTDADKYLCNIKLDDGKCSSVYSVDKKFLFGYWKSCFAARQQLYLVFFRAEPMALGGGITGVTPPQLGARGVALVWRDPYDPNYRRLSSADSGYTRHYPQSATTGDAYRPHKTRVLFYRQFE